jgi:hypothetical protein
MSEVIHSSVLPVEAPAIQSGILVQDGLERVLATFGEVRKTSPLGSQSHLWSVMEALKRDIQQFPSLGRETCRMALSFNNVRYSLV